VRDAAILLAAALFAGMGLGALARPAMVLEQFGVAVETAAGRNEVRAVYGGFGLAAAALLAVAALGDPATAEGIVIALAFALLGMAGGRLVSAVGERPGGLFPVWLYFGVEVVGGALLLASAWA
jgi:hypothetical protein